MYIEKAADDDTLIRVPFNMWGVLAVLVVVMVSMGVYPFYLADFAEQAAATLFS